MAYCAFVSFLLALLGSVIFSLSILWPLAFGVAVFSLASLKKGLPVKELFAIYTRSAREIFPVLLMLTVAGTLTASWRISGTIPFLICLVVDNLDPTFFYLWIYLVCVMVITFVGSALGTISMVGTVFVVLANLAGLDTFIASGAAISGIATGSRWSPFAPSQVLLSNMTGIHTFKAFSGLFRTACPALLVTCGLYIYLSLTRGTSELDTRILDGMRETFVMSYWLLLPIMMQLVMAVARFKTIHSLFVSSMTAYILAAVIQDNTLSEMWAATLHGYDAPAKVSQMAGGGIPAMITPIFILLFASPYSYLLKAMGLLDEVVSGLPRLVERFGLNRTIFVLIGGISAFACNPLLAIITAHPLCQALDIPQRETAVVLSSSAMAWGYVVPWSLICLVPFSFLQTDASCLQYSFFPICMIIYTLSRKDDIIPKPFFKKSASS